MQYGYVDSTRAVVIYQLGDFEESEKRVFIYFFVDWI